MARTSLPSASSVVDFLKSQGKDSSFSSRRKLFRDMGLEDRLGSFTGSSNQNQALLKQLQNSTNQSQRASDVKFDPFVSGAQSPAQSTQPDTAPVTSFQEFFNTFAGSLGRGLGAAQRSDTSVFGEQGRQQTQERQQPQQEPLSGQQTKVPEQDVAGARGTLSPEAEAAVRATPAQRFLAQAGVTPEVEETPTPAQQPTEVPETERERVLRESTEVADEARQALEQSRQRDQQIQEKTGGVSASTVVSEGTEGEADVAPSEADLVNDWLESPEGQLFLDRQEKEALDAKAKNEAAKQQLEAKYEQEKSSLEQKLASRGLAFSGIRSTQVKALADSLASSLLEADRELASKLLDANLDLRESILEGVADLIDEAQKEAKAEDKQAEARRKEAISQLNKLGFAVIPGDDGEMTLEPTLSARREQRIAETPQVSIQVNEAGQISGVDKNTGQVLWRTEAGVGRAGSASPNISVQPIADPTTGGVGAIQVINRDTGEVEFRDPTTGQAIDPSEVQLREGQDSIDALVDSILGDINLDEAINEAG